MTAQRSPEDGDSTIRAMFEGMHQEVAALDARMEALRELQEAMAQAGEVFDAEDHDLVSNSLEELSREREQRRSDHDARVRLYEENILALQKTLETRKRLLERVDGENSVLRSNSGLMNAFAHKQAELENKLVATKQVLCAGRGDATG